MFFVGIKGKDVDPLEQSGLSGVSTTDSFYKESADKKNILDTITKTARIIYNLQTIPVKKSGKVTLKPDIPVSKFIIFAQGDDVNVGSVQYNGSDLTAQIDRTEVEVSSKRDAHPKNDYKKDLSEKFADNLKGEIITYSAESAANPFPAGEYAFSCKADTLEVYFEPGVDIQVLMVNDSNGEVYNLSDGVDYLEEGSYSIRIQMVNPLTGEIVESSASKLLSGCELGAVVKTNDRDTGQETEKYYRNGEMLTVKPGDLEIQGRAVFKDDSEKTSNVSSIHVGAGGLSINFAKSEYILDPLHLAESEIEFQILDKKQVLLSPEEYKNLKISTGGLQGINCSVESSTRDGWYRIRPRCDEANGIAGINTASQNLTVSVSLDDKGHDRMGTASVVVVFQTAGKAELDLTMKTPEPKVDGGRYMFDAEQDDRDPDNPHILITVRVKEENGTLRAMNQEEWDRGLNGFTYRSSAVSQGIGWRLLEIAYHQTLNFKVEKGDEISEYKLYLTGLIANRIRPNTSELAVALRVELPNGVTEEGGTEGIITVRPMGGGFIPYIIGLIIILIVLALIAWLLFLEINKPRLPKDLTIHIKCAAEKINGQKNVEAISDKFFRVKTKYSIFPPNAPEEGFSVIKQERVLNSTIKIRLVADKNKSGGNRHSFYLMNAGTIFPKKNGVMGNIDVRINNQKPDALTDSNIKLTTTSCIYMVMTGYTEGKLVVQFTRMKKQRPKKAAKAKKPKKKRNNYK